MEHSHVKWQLPQPFPSLNGEGEKCRLQKKKRPTPTLLPSHSHIHPQPPSSPPLPYSEPVQQSPQQQQRRLITVKHLRLLFNSLPVIANSVSKTKRQGETHIHTNKRNGMIMQSLFSAFGSVMQRKDPYGGALSFPFSGSHNICLRNSEHQTYCMQTPFFFWSVCLTFNSFQSPNVVKLWVWVKDEIGTCTGAVTPNESRWLSYSESLRLKSCSLYSFLPVFVQPTKWSSDGLIRWIRASMFSTHPHTLSHVVGSVNTHMHAHTTHLASILISKVICFSFLLGYSRKNQQKEKFVIGFIRYILKEKIQFAVMNSVCHHLQGTRSSLCGRNVSLCAFHCACTYITS